jgi:hypothetical protein
MGAPTSAVFAVRLRTPLPRHLHEELAPWAVVADGATSTLVGAGVTTGDLAELAADLHAHGIEVAEMRALDARAAEPVPSVLRARMLLLEGAVELALDRGLLDPAAVALARRGGPASWEPGDPYPLLAQLRRLDEATGVMPREDR